MGFAGVEALLRCPAAKDRHGRGNLLEIPLNHPLEEIDPSFPPGVYLRRRQQAHSTEHVDCADVLLMRQGRFRSAMHPTFELRLIRMHTSDLVIGSRTTFKHIASTPARLRRSNHGESCLTQDKRA